MPELTFQEEDHIYMLDGVVIPSVTQALHAEGFIDDRWFTEESSIRGTYVHLASHMHDMGTLDEDTLDPVLVPYLDGYKQFLDDTGFEVLESEVRQYHKTYLYAGTPDKKGLLYGRRSLIDLKSGKPEAWVKLQLGGYWLLDEPCDCYSLQLKPDGTYNFSEKIKDIRHQGQVFLSALVCHQWKNNH